MRAASIFMLLGAIVALAAASVAAAPAVGTLEPHSEDVKVLAEVQADAGADMSASAGESCMHMALGSGKCGPIGACKDGKTFLDMCKTPGEYCCIPNNTAPRCQGAWGIGSCIKESECQSYVEEKWKTECAAGVVCCVPPATVAAAETVTSVIANAGMSSVKTMSATAFSLPANNTVEATPLDIAMDAQKALKSLVTESSCAKHSFTSMNPYKGRTIIAGRPPKGYIHGMALVWAKQVCNPQTAIAVFAGKARTTSEKDVLNGYSVKMNKAKFDNSKSGLDTLRHVYTLMIGLGMCETSGMYCTGRDMSANFNTANTCEAGLFQASWGGAVNAGPFNILNDLKKKYESSKSGCLLKTFSDGIRCRASDWKNAGKGAGMEYQKLAKECPAFAVEYTSALLRTNMREWNPLRKQYAELRTECDSMLSKVQQYVQANPGVCKLLLA